MSAEDILIQKVTLIQDGKSKYELDLSFLKEATYIETMDLSGPKLIMQMDDKWRVVRDAMKAKENDVLEVTLSDRYANDAMDKTVQFTILTPPVTGTSVVFNCIQKDVYALLQPSAEAILFSKKSISFILSRLAPDIPKTDLASIAVMSDYHLLPGMRPVRMLRQWEMENGAMLFWRRGTLVCAKLSDILKEKAEIKYHHNDQAEDKKIAFYSQSNVRSIIEGKAVRNYQGWDMVNGVVKSSKDTDAPVEFVSLQNTALMGNLSTRMPIPAIDFTAIGDGALMPGIPLDLVWNADRVDAPIDESLPEKVAISSASHYYSAQKYFTRVEGVTL